MSAKVLLDVDLEDKLLYGLTPMRLAYVVVALLTGFALWSERWAPTPMRAAACLMVIGLGSVLAWARWRGRAADRWLTDLAIFVVSAYRIKWDRHWLRGLWQRRHLRKPRPQRKATLTNPVGDRHMDGGAAGENTTHADWTYTSGSTVRR